MIAKLFKKSAPVVTQENTILSLVDDSSEKDLLDELDSKARLIQDLEKKIQILEDENLHLKKGLVNIQSNLASSVGSNQQALEELASVSKSFELINTNSKQLKDESKELSTLMSETKESSKKIELGVEEILESVSGISEVAMQTKLLSFNASVEAARAGEAGKGFSVVAQEIQSLSNSTTDLLKKIEESVSAFKEISSHLDRTLSKSVDSTNKIDSEFTSFTGLVEKTKSQNDISFNSISATSDHVFMTLAKLDHIVWKINTYISFIENKPTFEFVDHKNCRLGKWYENGEGKTNFSHTTKYGSLRDPHSKVHDATKSIFNLLGQSAPNFDQIKIEIDHMEKSSDTVFEYLDLILKEKQKA